ncbi:hypothetical protein ACET3Z_030201 [Daucus carota]
MSRKVCGIITLQNEATQLYRNTEGNKKYSNVVIKGNEIVSHEFLYYLTFQALLHDGDQTPQTSAAKLYDDPPPRGSIIIKSMADAVISFAIEKLGDFLVHQANIRIGVRDDIRWLKEELGLLQATVELAESRQEEKLIRLWLNNVRDVANEAVDILKRFQDGQASLEQGQGHMDRFVNCICICKKEAQLYDIGNNIESLKKRIGVIKERRLEFGIDSILAGPDVKQKERTLIRASAIDKHVDVVGFKDPPLKIISIHGMGGLGKTSLATKLYNSNELRHFGTRAKVCVSNDYNIKDVLKRIIKSFKGPEHEQYISNMDERDLLQYLPKLLQEQGCYLALIDDI